MTTDQQHFDSYFKSRGGLFDFKAVGGNALLRKILDSFNNQIKRNNSENSKLVIPHIDIINNNELNACAAKSNSKYFIGFYLGAVYVLKDIFYRMLSNKSILPNIGVIDNETNPIIFNAQITSLNQLFLAKDPDEQIIPKDPVRMVYADVLHSHALNFLLDHEYAHISHGHVDYITAQFNANTLWEISQESSMETLFSQTLEMDADCSAVNSGIATILEAYQKSSFLPVHLRQYYSNFDESLVSWCIAIYTFFRIFSFADDHKKDIKTQTHPNSGLRQSIVMATIATILNEKFNSRILDNFVKNIGRITDTVEEAFSAISHQDYNPIAFYNAFRPEAQEHVHYLMKNWNNVRPLLEPLAMKNLPPLNND